MHSLARLTSDHQPLLQDLPVDDGWVRLDDMALGTTKEGLFATLVLMPFRRIDADRESNRGGFLRWSRYSVPEEKAYTKHSLRTLPTHTDLWNVQTCFASDRSIYLGWLLKDNGGFAIAVNDECRVRRALGIPLGQDEFSSLNTTIQLPYTAS